MRATIERDTKITPVRREAVRPPKFADKFKQLDFDAIPLPAISLYPLPSQVERTIAEPKGPLAGRREADPRTLPPKREASEAGLLTSPVPSRNCPIQAARAISGCGS